MKHKDIDEGDIVSYNKEEYIVVRIWNHGYYQWWFDLQPLKPRIDFSSEEKSVPSYECTLIRKLKPMTIIDKDLAYCPVPEGAYGFDIENGRLRYGVPNGIIERSVKLPAGYQYEVIGLVPGLSEEQCKGLVQHGHCSTNGCELFRDYNNDDNALSSALESFASRMEAAGAYLVNPMGEKMPQAVCWLNKKGNNNNQYDIQRWHESQSRTSKSWVVMRVVKI